MVRICQGAQHASFLLSRISSSRLSSLHAPFNPLWIWPRVPKVRGGDSSDVAHQKLLAKNSGFESEILIFADDTTLLASGLDPAETSAQLNRDLDRISEWATKWKVSFNAKKSRDMIFSTKLLNNSPPIIFNGVLVQRVNLHKHLGVIFESNLCWSAQIHEICTKANRKLSVLKSVKQLNRKTLDLLYKLTIRSVIDYALPLYGNNLKQTELSRFENIQYRSAKVVTCALSFTSKEKLDKQLGSWDWVATCG